MNGLSGPALYHYLLAYGFAVGIMLSASLYLLLSHRPAFGKLETVNMRVRKIIGFNLILWILTYTEYALIYNNVSEFTKFIIVIITISILAPSYIYMIFSILQNRPVHVHLIIPSVVPLIGILIYYLITHNNNAYRFLAYAWAALLILATFIFIKRQREYIQWLKENFSDLPYIQIYSGTILVLFLLFQIICFYYRIFYTSSIMGWLGDLSNILFSTLLVLVADNTPNLELKLETKTDSLSSQMEIPTEVSDSMISEENYSKPETQSDSPSQNSLDWIGQRLQKHCEKEKAYLNADLTAPELASIIGTNRTYLSKYFASQNTTYYNYINNLRINHAISLMGDSKGNSTLILIAARSGFSNIRSFYRIFKEIQGCTPTEYLEKKKTTAEE